METEQRRQRYANYIRATFSQERPLFRHITFVYPPATAERAAERTEVRIDGQESGKLVLEVRSASLSDAQGDMLRKKGFSATSDNDDPRYTLYSTEVHNASTDDLVTFVDWVHLSVLGAPENYDAAVETLTERNRGGGDKGKTGCRSCMSVITVVFWVILGIILLNVLFR